MKRAMLAFNLPMHQHSLAVKGLKIGFVSDPAVTHLLCGTALTGQEDEKIPV